MTSNEKYKLESIMQMNSCVVLPYDWFYFCTMYARTMKMICKHRTLGKMCGVHPKHTAWSTLNLSLSVPAW